MPPQADNPQGFWEPLGVVRLNDAILKALGGAWDRPGPFLIPRLSLDESRDAVMSQVEQQYFDAAAAAMEKSYGGAASIVLKDPRITALLPFWVRVIERLGYRSRYVLIFRNPLEVAASLEARDKMPPRRALQLWQHYIVQALALELTGKLDDVVGYTDLLVDPEWVLGKVIDKSLPWAKQGFSDAGAQLRQFVAQAHQHHPLPSTSPLRSASVPRLVQETWSLLNAWHGLAAADRASAVSDIVRRYQDGMLFAGPIQYVTVRQLAGVDDSARSAQAGATIPAPTEDRSAAIPSEAQSSPTSTAAAEIGSPTPAVSTVLPAAAAPAADGAGERIVLLHYHLFKNAGTSVDEMLKRNFGERWAEAEFGSVPGQSNVAEVEDYLRQRPELLALSSHTALLPSPRLERTLILPVLFLRHPIDRLRSAYTFEQRQSADTFGARLAKAEDFAGYTRTLLQLPKNRQARNFQAFRLAFNQPTTAGSELARALRVLDDFPFIGLVEAYDASLEKLQQTYEPFIPGFQTVSVRKNVTRTSSEPLEVRLKQIEEELGSSLYSDLLAANADDLELHGIVSKRYRQ